MKTLIETEEMKKHQDRARKAMSENKVLDIDAVQIGWKLHNGSVIVNSEKGFEIEITSNLPATDGLVNVKVNGKDGQTTKSRIAGIVLTQPVEVYYSK